VRNELAGQTSPYLLQHAGNPVHWQAWGEAALAQARALDRPILLSIGYSACHWCHVMEHESFADPDTAALMNEHFVNIKVDREERPDLDKIYQSAHYLLTGRNGGWPLTMFLAPRDLTPFFGGTYFPREGRYGLPGFKDLLQRVATAYRERRTDIEQQNQSLRRALEQAPAAAAADAPIPGAQVLAAARRQAEESFDRRHGGFGSAPKFPQPAALDRLLRQHAGAARQGGSDTEARDMVLHTLRAMACGGLFDQLGGGFYRYSTDERWSIPHFEKMLYDNGLLLALYARAWQLSGEALLRDTALATADWALGEMRAPGGGFCSSLDADSAGEEGRYYVWDREEAQAVLDPASYRLVAAHYGLDGAANFEGRWHLRVVRALGEAAAAAGIDPDRAAGLLRAARMKLLEARAARTRPGRDDKVLTAWNALLIRGLAVAGWVFERDDYLEAATTALDHVREVLYRDGRLLASARNGHAHLDAYLDDHAFLIEAVLALAEARWRDGELDFAITLADTLLERFEDRDNGGFFFTAHDHEHLLQRPRSFADDALPSGNGVAARALQRLGHLLGDTRYLEAAAATLRAAAPWLERVPAAHDALLVALEEYLEPTETVILRGAGVQLRRWQRRASTAFAPQRQVLAIPDTARALPGLLAERRATGTGTVTAYLCRGHACEAPIAAYETLDRLLSETELPRP